MTAPLAVGDEMIAVGYRAGHAVAVRCTVAKIGRTWVTVAPESVSAEWLRKERFDVETLKMDDPNRRGTNGLTLTTVDEHRARVAERVARGRVGQRLAGFAVTAGEEWTVEQLDRLIVAVEEIRTGAKRWRFHWKDGATVEGSGTTAADALNALGYGRGAVAALDYHEEIR